MPRPLVSVREATEDDAPELVRLWGELVVDAGIPGRTSEEPTVEGLRRRLAGVADAPHRRAVLAEIDGETVGMIVLEHQPVTPLHESMAVRVAYLHVRREHRRRGVGHALLAEAAGWAAALAAEHVVVDVHPGDREANRFCARLGLSPLHVQRIAPTGQLRRLLASDSAAAVPELARAGGLRARLRSAVVDPRLRRAAGGAARAPADLRLRTPQSPA